VTGFLITDKQHKIYYASEGCEKIFGISPQKLRDSTWLDKICSPTPDFVPKFIVKDVKENGFYNGYLNFRHNAPLWFCDYGKRYDVNGNHIGFDLIINDTSPGARDYMNHFYDNLQQQIKSNPSVPADTIYEKEQNKLQQAVGTHFNEFMIALQAEDA